MEMIREWVVTILSVIIFVTFIEILIPNSNYKRYVNVVIGLLVMVIILSPLNKLIRGDVDMTESMLETSQKIEHLTMEKRLDSYEAHQSEMIIGVYEDNLKKQIKMRIEDRMDYRVASIDLDIEVKDQANLGHINEISLTLHSQANEVIENANIELVKVSVQISEKNNNTQDIKSISISNEEEDVIRELSDYYNIAKDNVFVQILKEN
ncbi:Sporulation stage III, protein AF [Alkaliphilus metalliredigens QYMF]|uniref:Sporulation stage III, protein AF n=1 Tax=Alkaliphilus metalliredigens (strain QYMF) TaxID=293826 RepID=A6TR32_ALKMQ|nr:stage III sporulation protein AF [Alkaliphilus metalliredigens]ABR48650.1 Sporulation stage III, protein AF [Alkaliphilus metalliredigens QYMF]